MASSISSNPSSLVLSLLPLFFLPPILLLLLLRLPLILPMDRRKWRPWLLMCPCCCGRGGGGGLGSTFGPGPEGRSHGHGVIASLGRRLQLGGHVLRELHGTQDGGQAAGEGLGRPLLWATGVGAEQVLCDGIRFVWAEGQKAGSWLSCDHPNLWRVAGRRETKYMSVECSNQAFIYIKVLLSKY